MKAIKNHVTVAHLSAVVETLNKCFDASLEFFELLVFRVTFKNLIHLSNPSNTFNPIFLF